MKILFLSERFLLPMDTGGAIRSGKILEHLSQSFDITLISNIQSTKDNENVGQMTRFCSKFYGVQSKKTNKYTPIFYLRLLFNMFSRYPFSVVNDYSKAIENKILDLLMGQKFDLAICDFLQPSLNFKKVHSCPTVFQHNVESLIFKRHLLVARNFFLKFFWWLQWKKMENYERKACTKFEGVITVSEADEKIHRELFGVSNVFVVPTGVDIDYFKSKNPKVKDDTLVFVGSMDWLPNEDAVQYFVRDIFGKIGEHIPEVKLVIVGRNPSNHLKEELKSHPGIRVTGRVEDVRPYIDSSALYIIPLRIGGGTRIKAYEAMSMGKTIVSTSIGIEGLTVKNGEHVVIADSAEAFAYEVVRLLRNKKDRTRIERNAQDYVRANFSWNIAAETFKKICRQIVNA